MRPPDNAVCTCGALARDHLRNEGICTLEGSQCNMFRYGQAESLPRETHATPAPEPAPEPTERMRCWHVPIAFISELDATLGAMDPQWRAPTQTTAVAAVRSMIIAFANNDYVAAAAHAVVLWQYSGRNTTSTDEDSNR